MILPFLLAIDPGTWYDASYVQCVYRKRLNFTAVVVAFASPDAAVSIADVAQKMNWADSEEAGSTLW